MPIVCGTDLLPASEKVIEVAARLAAAWKTPLELAHVIDTASGPIAARFGAGMIEAARIALQGQADRCASSGATVHLHVLEGKPDEALARLAADVNAKAVIVGAVGSRSADAWQVGASADRTAQLCTAPVLVVRDAGPLVAWLERRRPLRVVVAVDGTRVSAEAVAFAGALREIAPADVTLLHVYWASEEFRRFGLRGVRSLVDPEPTVEKLLEREVRASAGALRGEGRVEVALRLWLGRPSDPIVQFVDEARPDLVIVGSHRRNLAGRLWNGSTSRGVLHRAHASVACVTAAEEAQQGVAPEVRSVLVATDLAPASDAAVRWAYGLVRSGGMVHLVHVAPALAPPDTVAPRDVFDRPADPSDADALDHLEHQLLQREPADARDRGITTTARALAARDVAGTILQAAERIGVDAIVLGTRGRTGVARAVLGSVAQDIAAKATRPVLLVHPPKG